MSVIWHDLECGGYAEDMPLWRSLAAAHGDPVLDVGAGTGRIALDLARLGHRVTALDSDPELLAELALRGRGGTLETVLADARAFELEQRFGLCIVPMQTIQLLGGLAGRASFLQRARLHLRPQGVLAVALAEAPEPFEVLEGELGPLPDMRELGGVLYSSHAIAVREDRSGFVLERRREIVTERGRCSVQNHRVRLDRLGPSGLEREALTCGLRPAGRAQIPATEDHVGSAVVLLSA